MANGCTQCGGPRYSYNHARRGRRTSSLCKDCLNARRRAAYDPAVQRSRSLMKRYGMSQKEFEARLAAQGGCAACGAKQSDGKFWHVDHDHACCPSRASSCGRCVRGILCHGCNTALGNVGDDSTRLRSLASYVERFQ